MRYRIHFLSFKFILYFIFSNYVWGLELIPWERSKLSKFLINTTIQWNLLKFKLFDGKLNTQQLSLNKKIIQKRILGIPYKIEIIPEDISIVGLDKTTAYFEGYDSQTKLLKFHGHQNHDHIVRMDAKFRINFQEEQSNSLWQRIYHGFGISQKYNINQDDHLDLSEFHYTPTDFYTRKGFDILLSIDTKAIDVDIGVLAEVYQCPREAWSSYNSRSAWDCSLGESVKMLSEFFTQFSIKNSILQRVKTLEIREVRLNTGQVNPKISFNKGKKPKSNFIVDKIMESINKEDFLYKMALKTISHTLRFSMNRYIDKFYKPYFKKDT